MWHLCHYLILYRGDVVLEICPAYSQVIILLQSKLSKKPCFHVFKLKDRINICD